MATAQANPEPIFVNLTSESEPTVIESLCTNCEENGKTTFLFTKIPFFQEVIVVAFECEHCGWKNSELQPAGKIKDQGLNISLKLIKNEDLNRDIVKSEHCTFRLPEVDFEIPATKTKGSLNTVEGFLSNVIEDLAFHQELRKIQDPENYEKIEAFIAKLQKMKDGEAFPFTLELDDPSGNSYIKNPYAPNEDPQMKVKHYNRTKQQIEAMGYSAENEEENRATAQPAQVDETITAHKMDFSKPLVEKDSMKEESLSFFTPCHECGKDGETNMCTISVPYFKELIIMAFTCEKCGAKSREVKVGGEISEKAKKITFRVDHPEDLNRDLFKSETAIIAIPEVELELTLGDVGGIYTTVEGLIEQIHDHMKDNNPFVGDSSESEFKQRLDEFFAKLQDLRALKQPWTLILDDPMANCFIMNPDHPKPDPKVQVEVYERTFDQNEHLGINDIKTENY